MDKSVDARGREVLLSSDVKSDAVPLFRGYLDWFHHDRGLEGWAISLLAPEQPLEVELVIGSTVIARRMTTQYRADISELLQKEVFPGFCFEPNWFEGFKNYFSVHGDSGIKIRISGTDFYLASASEGPTLGSVFQQMEEHVHRTDSGFSLTARLSDLSSSANELVSQPLRPIDDCLLGYIEAIAVDDSNFVWFIGWMKENSIVDHAAVIVDRQKITAGMTFSHYAREDVGAGAYGVIGALLTDWRPSSNSEPIVYFGPNGKYHLRSVAPLRVISVPEFVRHVTEVNKLSMNNSSKILLEFISSAVPVADGYDLSVRAAIDKVLILPAFGVFVSGWVTSSLLKVRSFAVRFGKLTLECDSQSLYFKQRPDLLESFPGDFNSISRAGFCFVCRGNIPITDLKEPILKVFFEDGSSRNYPVSASVINRLGHSISLDSILELYPSLEEEPFFPKLVSAFCSELSKASRQISPHQVRLSSHAIIVIVPEERHDCFLLFENLRRGAASFLGSGCGVVLVVGTDQSHGELLSLFAGLSRSLQNPCSLFFIEKPECGLYALPEILMLTHVQRFGFLADGKFLTKQGWQGIEEKIYETDNCLTFLEIIDPAQEVLSGKCSSAAFVWSSERFSSWLVQAPIVLGEHIAAQYFPHGERPLVFLEKAVHFSRMPVSSRLISAINRQTLIALQNGE
jgi:hypothetical protein